MNTKTVLVTGATDGIGRQTAIELARQGAKVLIHGRDKAKGAKVLDEINRDNCNENLVLYLADFSSFADIKRMADEIKREQSSPACTDQQCGDIFQRKAADERRP